MGQIYPARDNDFALKVGRIESVIRLIKHYALELFLSRRKACARQGTKKPCCKCRVELVSDSQFVLGLAQHSEEQQVSFLLTAVTQAVK